ncbi:hypothetical protein [Aeromonas salmonicida]|uniref:hypothetical protein n=1 Tax=Aeromonas salmonicida TaxID=645 RepID=UPI00073BE1EE|nr:hypothetical protein [Aeromonas salmonicida]KTA76422.1 hypothetical protein VO70_21550 [Aeromonas salmonicida]
MSITTEHLTHLGSMISKSNITQDDKYEILEFLDEIIHAQKLKDHFILNLAVLFDQNNMQEMATECRKFVFE